VALVAWSADSGRGTIITECGWIPLTDAAAFVINRVKPSQKIVDPGSGGLTNERGVRSFTFSFEAIRNGRLQTGRETAAKSSLIELFSDIDVLGHKIDRRSNV